MTFIARRAFGTFVVNMFHKRLRSNFSPTYVIKLVLITSLPPSLTTIISLIVQWEPCHWCFCRLDEGIRNVTPRGNMIKFALLYIGSLQFVFSLSRAWNPSKMSWVNTAALSHVTSIPSKCGWEQVGGNKWWPSKSLMNLCAITFSSSLPAMFCIMMIL